MRQRDVFIDTTLESRSLTVINTRIPIRLRAPLGYENTGDDTLAISGNIMRAASVTTPAIFSFLFYNFYGTIYLYKRNFERISDD